MTDDQKTWGTVFDSPCLLRLGPWRIDECAECELCGGCTTHECYEKGATAVLHMDWLRDFASPGEQECGSVGGPSDQVPVHYKPRPCNLPAGHQGDNHRARMGWSWPAGERAAKNLSDPAVEAQQAVPPCPHCGGEGADPEDEGDWIPEVHQHNPYSRGPCPQCDGRGTLCVCACTSGSPAMYEGPSRDCPVHGGEGP